VSPDWLQQFYLVDILVHKQKYANEAMTVAGQFIATFISFFLVCVDSFRNAVK